MDLNGFNKLRYAPHSKDYKKITSRAKNIMISRMRIFVSALMSCGLLLQEFWVFSESFGIFLAPGHTNE